MPAKDKDQVKLLQTMWQELSEADMFDGPSAMVIEMQSSHALMLKPLVPRQAPKPRQFIELSQEKRANWLHEETLGVGGRFAQQEAPVVQAFNPVPHRERPQRAPLDRLAPNRDKPGRSALSGNKTLRRKLGSPAQTREAAAYGKQGTACSR